MPCHCRCQQPPRDPIGTPWNISNGLDGDVLLRANFRCFRMGQQSGGHVGRRFLRPESDARPPKAPNPATDPI
eukprot:6714991-Pyramimonas_sp.AAC.1